MKYIETLVRKRKCWKILRVFRARKTADKLLCTWKWRSLPYEKVESLWKKFQREGRGRWIIRLSLSGKKRFYKTPRLYQNQTWGKHFRLQWGLILKTYMAPRKYQNWRLRLKYWRLIKNLYWRLRRGLRLKYSQPTFGASCHVFRLSLAEKI